MYKVSKYYIEKCQNASTKKIFPTNRRKEEQADRLIPKYAAKLCEDITKISDV